MNTTLQLSNNTKASHLFATLTSRLTIGSALCLAEGLYASIMPLVARNHWFYIFGAVLNGLIFLAFLRFRTSKIGAEVGDLCFYDLLARSVALVCYFSGIDAGVLWYLFATLFVLKIFRVYLWQSSATQQNGWGIFGPLTLLQAKQTQSSCAAMPWRALAFEIVLLLIAAALLSIGIKQLTELQRVVAVWIVPFIFEFRYGPIQMLALSAYENTISASEKREAALAEENAMLKRVIDAKNGSSGDPLLDQYIAAYAATDANMRDIAVEYAKEVATQFPAKPPTQE